jgi:hypothetical protein
VLVIQPIRRIPEALGLLAGLLLSIGGVFGVQSISHELACRLLMDKPERLADILTARRAVHANHVESIRQEVRERYMAAKLADQERKTIPFGSYRPAPDAHGSTTPTQNGNGHIDSESVTK